RSGSSRRSRRELKKSTGNELGTVGGIVVLLLGEDSAPPRQAQHARANGGDGPGDLDVGRRQSRVEAQRAVGGFGEHVIEYQRVGMKRLSWNPEPKRWIPPHRRLLDTISFAAPPDDGTGGGDAAYVRGASGVDPAASGSLALYPLRHGPRPVVCRTL